MKQLTEMDLMELKSLAYDLVVAQDKIRNELNFVQSEINKKTIKKDNEKPLKKRK